MIRKSVLIGFFMAFLLMPFFAFQETESAPTYEQLYTERVHSLQSGLKQLLDVIKASDLSNPAEIESIKTQLMLTRSNLKQSDFWIRYIDPIGHKKINGPLPVEWETEVFEKYEKPYKRNGAGLTLAYQYLEEDSIVKDSLVNLIQESIYATAPLSHDSTIQFVTTPGHFYLCNRLYLLNLAAIYTTGFDNPNGDAVISELKTLLRETGNIYSAFNESSNDMPFPQSYLELYYKTIDFVYNQPLDYTKFDHYTFVRDYVNPLYALNQELILKYKVVSRSLIDYSLNKQAASIFSKSLYFGQNPKGIYYRVSDPETLLEIEELGKTLFFDPLLSGNILRSCASCHKPEEAFTDTAVATSAVFSGKGSLARNSPSLLNAQYNHLLMADGKHYTLQAQVKAVIANPDEMNCSLDEMIGKVMSCKSYASTLKNLLKETPQEKQVTADHIASAITYYYSKFSRYDSPFDLAMNRKTGASEDVQKGFNLFMGKAQCATCHFPPQFNGVKPPYVGSEFEVLGVPADTAYKSLSQDKGRYVVNPATQTLSAFRTGTVRNAAKTAPYMHNGVFSTLTQVIDFYDGGGGAGRGLIVSNQTLSADSLKLSPQEKKYLITFIESLTEKIPQETPPVALPLSANKALNNRKVGGQY